MGVTGSTSQPTTARGLTLTVWVGVAIAAAAALSFGPVGRLLAIVACAVLFYRWPLERFILGFVAISLAAEERGSVPFAGLWRAPWQHLADFWFETVKRSVPMLPIPASPMLLFALACFARVVLDRSGPGLTRPGVTRTIPRSFRSAVVVALLVIGAMAVYGIARGGDVQQLYYQVFGPVLALTLAASTARVGSERFARSLLALIVAIATYRAALAVWMYVTVLPDLDGPPPLYVTTHGDSVLWAVALAILFSRFIEVPSRATRAHLVLLGLPLLFAMVANNRRLGWVIIATAFAYVVVTSRGVVRRRLARLVTYLALPAAAYVIAALVAPPKRIFAPVQALQSVIQGSDSSSVTRTVEDFNLIFTMRANLPIGTGFGHPYLEVIRGADITQGVGSTFVNYQYLPHNSLLGLMMWIGPVGLALVLLPLMLGVRSALTVHQTSIDPLVRTCAVAVLTAWVAYVMEAWGDQGLYSGSPVVLIGVLAGLGITLGASRAAPRPAATRTAPGRAAPQRSR